MEIKTFADAQLFMAKNHREMETLLEMVCARAEVMAKELEDLKKAGNAPAEQ